MKEFLTTLTQRGQVTVPAEVRRVLGIRPKDKVTFQIEDGRVRLMPARFTLETAYGSVKPMRMPEDFSKIIREAVEEHMEAQGLQELYSLLPTSTTLPQCVG